LKANKELLLSLDIGGVQPSIKVPHLLKLEFPLPNDHLIQKFETKVDYLFKKVLQNQKQITSLTNVRDSLLPKLMSGQVRVNN
jgi:type I restriction enzyme S subunit